MVYVPTFVLGTEDSHCLLGRDPAGALGMMLDHETGKGFADDQTDIEGLAGM
jgi:hypothetical protein